MTFVHRRRGWEMRSGDITPERDFLDRRRFLTTVGAAGVSALGLAGCGRRPLEVPDAPEVPTASAGRYPAPRNTRFTLDRDLTDEEVAARYNNFYEFTSDKTRVWREAAAFRPYPWQVRVGGLCEAPATWDFDELIAAMPLEERLYRMRCVETWAMAVPWTGFPLKTLLDRVRPLSSAKFVRFLSFHRPDEAPGQKDSDDPWPYYEGLSLSEACNELTIMACGIYGRPMPKQHGAPLRLVVPWKYGFKSIKSVTAIELVAEQPRTFWSDKAPSKYDFEANVDPTVHKPWNQSRERMIGTREVRPTLPFNGYGEWVAHLYS